MDDTANGRKHAQLVIGFKGPRGVGKTTVAKQIYYRLSESLINVHMLSMSTPLVWLTNLALGYITELPFDPDEFDGDDAEIKATVLDTGKTYRQHLIDMSEGIKLAFGENYFVKAACEGIHEDGITLIHNVRFPAEAELCDYIVDVRAEGVYNSDSHRSERLHATIPHDVVFQNNHDDETGPECADYDRLTSQIIQWYNLKKDQSD